jgi:hypothetical protein
MSVFKKIQSFQADVPKLWKDSVAKAGSFSYNYKALEDIMEVILPLLHKHQLVVTQPFTVKGELNVLTTLVVDTETGDRLLSEFVVERDENVQDTGKAITYYRRYMLLSVLGLVTEKDDDAQGHRTTQAPKTTADKFAALKAKRQPGIS